MFNVLMMHVFNVNMMSEFSTGIYIVKKSTKKIAKQYPHTVCSKSMAGKQNEI